MATNSVLDYKWDQLLNQEDDDHDDEEQESLSLCDLPVTLIKDQDKPRKQDKQFGETEEEIEEDFDFNSWGTGLFSKEPEMCVADEVFFQGQILPFRHSFSSDPSISKIKESQMQHNGCNKKFNCSESMDDHEFGSNSSSSNSSRSCSLRSQNSSSSTSSTTAPTTIVSKPKIRNQFHTIPSPKPQLRQSRSATRETVFNFGNQGRKSSSTTSTWEFFRLGVSPAPEMLGLQDLQFRNRNSSSSSNNTTSHKAKSGVKRMSNKIGDDGEKSKRGGLLSGCSCTVDSVVAQLDTVMIKSSSTKIKKESVETATTTTHAVKEKVVVGKLNMEQQNKIKKHNDSSSNNNRKKQKAKKAMSRRRTFEWMKELHAIRHREDEEEALLSNT